MIFGDISEMWKKAVGMWSWIDPLSGDCKKCGLHWLECDCDLESDDVKKKCGLEQKKDPKYPHICPSCKGPAFIGLNQIDCKKGCK